MWALLIFILESLCLFWFPHWFQGEEVVGWLLLGRWGALSLSAEPRGRNCCPPRSLTPRAPVLRVWHGFRHRDDNPGFCNMLETNYVKCFYKIHRTVSFQNTYFWHFLPKSLPHCTPGSSANSIPFSSCLSLLSPMHLTNWPSQAINQSPHISGTLSCIL